jgi:hypothetical protein
MDHVLAMYFKFKIFLAQLELDFIYYSSTKSQNLLFQTLLQKTPHRIMHVFSNQIMWADYVVNIFLENLNLVWTCIPRQRLKDLITPNR